MGIDNEVPPMRVADTQPLGDRHPRRPLLPTLTTQLQDLGPVAAPPRQTQLEQQQLQQDKRLTPEVNTGELRRRSSDQSDLIEVTDDQRAIAAQIIAEVKKTPIAPEMKNNPRFIEAVDRFFSALYPVMEGTDDQKRQAAAEAAVIAARNDVHRQEQISEHKQDTRAALEKLNQARVQAETDELTGILNRRGIDRQLLQALLANKEVFTAIEVDLNLLKWLNDNFGEAAGDNLLVMTARALQDGIRGTDAVGRRGGDEILLILRGANLEQAKKIIARQIEPRLEAAKLPQAPEQSISLGGGIMEVNPLEYQGLSDEALNGKIEDLLLHLMAAMKEAKGMAKSPESITKRAFVEANHPNALARFEQLKADKSVSVNFMR